MVRGGASVPSYRQPSTEPVADASQPAKKSFLKVVDHQNQPASRSASSVPDSTSYSWQPPPGLSDVETLGHSESTSSYQRPSTATDASQPAKKSFLKVIDHKNQPANRSAGTGSISESTGWQSAPERRDESMPSYGGPTSSTNYRRDLLGDEARRAVDTDVLDPRRRLGVASDDRYGSRYDDIGRGFRSAADAGRYDDSMRDRSGFWNEMSAYCAEYEARVSRHDDGRDARSQPLRRPPTNLSIDEPLRRPPTNLSDEPLRRPPTNLSDEPLRRPPTNLSDDLDRRRTLESMMSGQRGPLPDAGDLARRYAAEDMDRRYRLQGGDLRDAELRRAPVDDNARYWTGARNADYEAAARMRDRLAYETKEYYHGTSADRTSRR